MKSRNLKTGKKSTLKGHASGTIKKKIKIKIKKEGANFKEIEMVDIALNSCSGAGNGKLGTAAMEAVSETGSPAVKVPLDNESYDEIFYEDGNVRLEIDGSVLEINDGKIMFSGYADDLKDMAEYLNEVEKFLLPENREALHQIKNVQENARKR